MARPLTIELLLPYSGTLFGNPFWWFQPLTLKPFWVTFCGFNLNPLLLSEPFFVVLIPRRSLRLSWWVFPGHHHHPKLQLFTFYHVLRKFSHTLWCGI